MSSKAQDPKGNADHDSEAPVLGTGTEIEPSHGSLPYGGKPILTVEHPDSTREQVNPSSPVAGSSSHLHPPPTSSDQPLTGMRSSSNASEPSNTSSQSEFDTFFRMIIHLPHGHNRQRLACLDTCSDMDVISHHVVDSLHLETEKYTGDAIRPLGPATNSYMPERKVTIDWNVIRFPKTYTTTFAVLDEDHGDEFDILLGVDTIKKISFYKKNKKVWWMSPRRQVCLSDDIDD
ncbi:MAG: hypothetical protein LQ337_008365 [Flavoplaca oasis]|nr:MAG: hypothetical protein LQ337_008365 [Flavoplaca oasis]